MSSLIKEIAMVTSGSDAMSQVFADFAVNTLEFISFLHKCHWRETSAQMHVILGDLYTELDEAADEFAEACIGSGMFTKDQIEMGVFVDFGASCAEGIEAFNRMLNDRIAIVSGVPQYAAVLDKLVDMQEALNKYAYLSTQQ